MRLGAAEIAANMADLLAEHECVYVATDEQDKEGFFGPLRERCGSHSWTSRCTTGPNNIRSRMLCGGAVTRTASETCPCLVER